jgi:hypothetical protein
MHTTARWQGYWSSPHTTNRSEYLLTSDKLDVRLISCQNVELQFIYLRLDAVAQTFLRGYTSGLLASLSSLDLTLLGTFEGFACMDAHFCGIS